MNALTRRPYGQLTNYFHANLKLKNEAQKEGQIVRGTRRPDVTVETKRRLKVEKAHLNPFALKLEVTR